MQKSNPRIPSPARRAAVALAAALLATLSLALPGRAPAQSVAGGTETFLDRVEVNVVNVEVFVTDRQGHRVSGLTRDDFVVRVDGEPIELTNFFAAAETAAAPASSGAADLATGGATAVEAIAPAPAAGDPQPLFLALYFDHVNLTPGSKKAVLDQAHALAFEQATAGNLVALFGYNGSLQAVTPFTSNLAALDAGFEEIANSSTRRQIANLELARALRGIVGAQSSGPAIPGGGGERGGPVWQDTLEVERYRQAREQEATAAYKALGEAAGSLGGLPGRKALVYVGEGIPKSPGAELNAFITDDAGRAALESQRYDLSRFYRDVIEQANAYGVTLYTLDARGAGESFGKSAEFADYVALAAGPDFDQTRNLNLQEPLLDMADATGGSAILNTANFADAFERLDEDFATYYSLGFPSPYRGDGTYHSIEVRVRDHAGYTVRHRNGFYDKSAADRIADRARSFLLQSWESNPLGVELQFGEPKKKSRLWRVPILVRVPAQSVVLLPQGDQRVGSLQLMVLVQDDDGRLSALTRLPAKIEVPAAAYESAHAEDLGYQVELEMRDGPAALVVAVWDEVGGGESYVFQRVKVGEG